MGAYYFYVNDTKRQYFSIDPVLEKEIKQSFVGGSIGSRALGFLLWGDSLESCSLPNHELIGSWIGDTLRVTSDDYGPEHDKISEAYSNIRQEIVEMLVVIEPFTVLDFAGEEWIESLVSGNTEGIDLTERMRESIKTKFSQEQTSYPDSFLERVLAKLNTD